MEDKNPNKTFKKQNSVKVIASRGFYYKEPTQKEINTATRVIIGHMKKGRYNGINHTIMETINKGSAEAQERGIHNGSKYTEEEIIEWDVDEKWDEDEHDR
jgi:hypothetical protein